MKKLLEKVNLFVLIIMMAIINNSCDKEDNVIKSPSIPILLEPTKGSIISDSEITFQWQSADAEKIDIRYTLCISKDSVLWDEIIVNNVLTYTLTSAVNPIYNNYYVFEKGKTYYWKVKAEKYSYEDEIIILEAEESISEISYFYTNPSGVDNLQCTSGNEFVSLYWDDPENTDYIEITFEPEVNSISQPVVVNAGTNTCEFNGLNNETIYSFYLKVYDKLNHVSETDSIKALPLLPNQVHDADFNIYNTITIGTQTWLRENLRVTKYSDGSPFTNGWGEPFQLENFYGSESNKYGLYYYSIIASGGYENDKNVCPSGYHVPSDADWKQLESFLGMSEDELNNASAYTFRGETENVGGSLKSTSGWNDYDGENGNGSDVYGFSILPSGYFNYDNVEVELDSTSLLWTSTISGTLGININRIFSNSSDGIRRSQSGLWLKAPIRCIKD